MSKDDDLSSTVRHFIDDQREKRRLKLEKDVSGARDEEAREKAEAALGALNIDYAPDRWLDGAAARARQILIVTHATKYAHSDAPGGGIDASGLGCNSTLLGTHSLDPSRLDLDIVGNAAALDVGNLLQLSNDRVFLHEQIAGRDDRSLIAFSSDPERRKRWLDGLGAAIGRGAFEPHTLVKQIYFPVDDEYHLLAPVFATSLAHAVYETVEAARFSAEAKEVRRQRRENEEAEEDDVFYPRVARMKYGGAQPQNISLLNSRRRGVAYLLSCRPPTWQWRIRPPVRGKNALWRLYTRLTRETVRELRDFLGRVDAYNNVAIRRRRTALVERLADEFVQLIATIRAETPGWSRESDLPLAEQCLLDPGRTDSVDDPSDFATMLETCEWADEVADSFGRWLNRRLDKMIGRSGRELRSMSDVEANEWASVLKRVSARMSDDLGALR